MLCCNLFSETLNKMGIEINPYNQCVANKEIDRKMRSHLVHGQSEGLSHGFRVSQEYFEVDRVKVLRGA